MKNAKLELNRFVVDVDIAIGMDYDEVYLLANFYEYENKDQLVSDLSDLGVIVKEVTEK